jgi:hypothetical protein
MGVNGLAMAKFTMAMAKNLAMATALIWPWPVEKLI